MPLLSPMTLFPFAVAIGASLVCFLISRYSFPYLAFEPDSAAYLFQAKLFAQGWLAADAPPDFGFSSSPHINIFHGLWYAKYPFGNSLFLTPGVLLGLPFVMPAIATGLTLLIFFSIVRELFGDRVAVLALVLAAISPTTIFMGSTLLSQPTSRLAVALFLWLLLRALGQRKALNGALLGALAGLALGYGFNTRPLVAVVFGVAALVLVFARFAQTRDLHGFFRIGVASAAGLAVMIALFLAWNAYLTGDPWLVPYHALQAADRMGFGNRGEGYAPYIADFGIHFTPAIAFMRIWQHTLPCVLFNMVGWGNYIPNMLIFSDPDRDFPLAAWLLVMQAALVALPLFHRSRSVGDIFCVSVFGLTLFALFFQYSDHSIWGTSPLHCSYYNEATLFGLIPLAARGILILYDEMMYVRFAPTAFGIAAVLLAIASFHTNYDFASGFRTWDPYYEQLPGLVADADIHNAVIFVPDSRNAPVGEYPFVPLDQADVVYFRTGPMKQWRLNTDWQTAYEKYFPTRTAYRFADSKLTRLAPASEENRSPAAE